MRLRNAIGSILLGGLVYACGGDRPSPTQPDQLLQIADAWSSGPPPDAPEEFHEDTRITAMDLNVYFADSFTATEVRFGAFATNVRVEASARLQSWDGGDLASDTDVEVRAEPWPWLHRVTAIAAVPYSTPCGLRNRGRGSYRAWHQYGGWEWGLKESSDGQIASLDPCSCDDTAVLSDPDYDPYNPDCDDSGSGGGDAGTGVFYDTGDYTGGTTVGWSTGEGTGWTSLCGAEAVVEYVCIEIWNESTEEWEQYSCGYATTCG